MFFYILWAPGGEIIIPSAFCVKRDVVMLQRTINRQCLETGCSGYLYISESNVRIASSFMYSIFQKPLYEKKNRNFSS